MNKTVPFRFRGTDFRFHLSHGLFSSFDIDEGTRLLLKSLAREVDLAALRSVLDVGCGVGVIGACVARHAPGARLHLQDRDALAVQVAQMNCRENGLEGISAECRLAFHGLAGGRFDLVASNIPAKAGAPVLHAFFRHAAGCLSPQGAAAVVIVAPLAAMARESIRALGCDLRHHEETAAYSVFHFGAGSAPAESDAQREDLAPYVRATVPFTHGGRQYVLETAHSLPDFDTIGHLVDLALDVLEGALAGDVRRNGTVLCWNPGQGHLPAAMARADLGTPRLIVASRDCLECAISTRNLTRMGMPPAAIHCIASEAELAGIAAQGSVDLLTAMPHPVPRVPWQPGLADSALRILRPGGRLLVAGTSTEIHRFLDRPGKLTLLSGRKREGFRAVLLGKPR